MGVPMISKSTVVVVASFIVSSTGCHNSALNILVFSSGSRYGIAVFFYNLLCRLGMQKAQKLKRRGVILTLDQEYSVLFDGLIEISRHQPGGPLSILRYLAQSHKTQFSIAGLYKLKGLTDILALNDFPL